MNFPDATISEHPFVSVAECDALVARLADHASLVIDRGPQLPGTFVTYGRAAYLDVRLPLGSEEDDYYSAIGDSNRGLADAFGDLLERLRTAIEGLAGDPVIYRPDLLALPGFHVFRGAGIRAVGANHFDVQYQSLRLPSPPDPGARPISVTVLLRGPASGTGLRIHDVSCEEYERVYREGGIASLDQLVARKSHAYWPYTPGKIVLHHGLIMHCLCSPGPIQPSDERITLQAHGVRCDGNWILYW